MTQEHIYLPISLLSVFNRIFEKPMYSLSPSFRRVSMGLTDRRKTAKNLVDSRKNWKILTIIRK